jgi:ferrous iron transport protein B
VPTAARQGRGIQELLQAVHDVATGKTVCKPYRLKNETPAIRRALAALVPKIEAAFPDLPNARWVALRLLDGDKNIIEAVQKGELGDLSRQTPLEAGQNHQIPLEVAS